MSILNKQLKPEALATLDLFAQGALAPLSGYLNYADHLNVLQNGRLANGYLWPLPFTLTLTAVEKRQAQLARRIILSDEGQRVIAEVEIEEIYRLPPDTQLKQTTNNNHWYVSGTITTMAKVLHPAFNRIRRGVSSIQNKLDDKGWQRVLAIHSSSRLQPADMQQADAWLKENNVSNSGILLQVNANYHPQLHEQMRELRHNIRSRNPQKVVLDLLPTIPKLDSIHQLLLQARIAKNYGATAFLIPSSTPAITRKALLRYRDELGLELIPVRRPQKSHTHLRRGSMFTQKMAA